MIKVFSTYNTIPLAQLAYKWMREQQPDIEWADHNIHTFSNSNMLIKIKSSVRDCDVIIFSTQVDALHIEMWELFLLINAINNSKAKSISVVFPYMPYSRSDRKDQSRVSVGSQCLSNILNAFHVNNYLLVEPHDSHIIQYFSPTADEIPLYPYLTEYIRRHLIHYQDRNKWVLVYPDAGAAKRYEKVAGCLGVSSAIIQKYRNANDEKPYCDRIIGEVGGMNCLLFDDEILTGNTLVKDAQLMKKMGAQIIIAVAAHGILRSLNQSDDELAEFLGASFIQRIISTNTVPIAHKTKYFGEKLTVLNAMKLIGEASLRMCTGDQISPLHNFEYYQNWMY